ncbi:MAG: ImmA/IrrE family metallo-endopeptidase [Candidatus Peribacteraceae bacterium]|nr:ImmA/IrrE family metallo-endopeptidase [Candidatus Peribacteraceae bacterium]
MLAPGKIKDIEAKAEDVLSTLIKEDGDISFPVPLAKIAENYGLTIKVVDFPKGSISGAYDRSIGTIYVSSSEPAQRQAFTIAHELGHALLHKDKGAEILYRTDLHDLDSPLPAEEQEANWFAASLLMPKDHVRRYFNVLDNPDLLATVFGVSPSAMRFRLKNLGLLK